VKNPNAFVGINSTNPRSPDVGGNIVGTCTRYVSKQILPGDLNQRNAAVTGTTTLEGALTARQRNARVPEVTNASVLKRSSP
jgi:hypothetical protein